MEITKHFFQNFSIIIIILFFFLVFLERHPNLNLRRFPVTLVFIVLLWSCIQFSYHPAPFARYDLRIIPLVIGGLYFGIGPVLAGATIALRSFYGVDIGFFQTVILYVPFAIIVWRVHPWFLKQIPSRRIIMSVSFTGILGAITVLEMRINETKSYWLDVVLAYLFIPAIGVFIIAYAIEFFRKSVKMQQQLIKSEKLKAVEQMGAAISHEIRNPLTAASGFVQLLQDDYLPRQKRKEYLSIVKDELLSAEKVIQDYLTFAKPDIGKLEEINVKSELRQIISILQPLANQNSVEILTDFSIIGYIRGDKQKFRQCFVNIIKNAIESMPNGGHLTIFTKFSQSVVTIVIEDTGEGMTSEQLAQLGEPFYSTKGKNGTGLGLMVVYGIVRAMNGTIRVNSELGAGTSFHITFPTISSIRKKS